MALTKQDDLCATIAQLLHLGEVEDVVEACYQGLEKYPSETKLWNLLGVALGSKGDNVGARKCFLTSLGLKDDPITLANYSVSVIASGDTELFCKIVDQFFLCLTFVGQEIVVQTIIEGLRCGQLEQESLPQVIKDLLQAED